MTTPMTMPEYIEKQKVLDILDELSVVDPIWEAVKRIPAAEVAPVRHERSKSKGTATPTTWSFGKENDHEGL